MPRYLYLDTETYSTRDLKKVGTYRYAEAAEIMLITWAVDDGPVQLWDHNDGTPTPDLAGWVRDNPDVVVVAFNAMFDRTVLRLGNLGIDIPIERWQCAMVQALQHALPGSLHDVGAVLGLPADASKDKDGRKLIQRFCKPAPSNHKADRYTKQTHPDEWHRFREYAKQDIVALREVHRRLPRWNWTPYDVANWHLDQRINDRGFAVDQELTHAGARAAVEEKRILAERFGKLTGGLAPTQREKVMHFLNAAYGLNLTATAKHVMQPIADDATQPDSLREIARIMLSANKNSTAKYGALAAATSSDGRFRGGLQFAGARRTRRWAGRTFQPQNLPSRGIPDPDMIEAYIGALKAGCHAYMFEDLMLYGAAALRGVLVAPPGRKLIIADLANIEGRILAWLAGELWKLQAFREYDAGTGPDLYKLTASGILGQAPEAISKADRNVFGKVPDLALGYEGGAGALQTFAKAYGVRMADHWQTIQQNVAPQLVERARDNYARWGHTKAAELGIDEIEWLASESVKLAWRDRHPATRRLWYACKDAACAAIRTPGTAFKAGEWLTFCVVDGWLLVKLPSGAFMTYYSPRVDGDDNITYMGYGDDESQPGGRVWSVQYIYGGKFVENICQAVAGDVLKASMPRAEAEGYEIVLSVHDEDVAETPDTPDYTADRLCEIMATPIPWAPGLPLAAEGVEKYRYGKY